MSHGQMHAVIRHLHRIVGQSASSQLADKQLLQRFATGRDEAAFAVLVQRHGPLVWGACWRVLHHTQDAEDAFQATFLVLARKAAAIRWRQSVGNWLYNVAYRVAYEAKGKAARRRVHERKAAALLKAGSPLEVARRELDAALDEELHQLPARYRAPLLLCYLEGETQDQAARHLGWSLRTLQRRLEQGRELLRTRLARRGLMLSTALLVSGLSQKAASVTAAARLAESTVRAATVFAAAPAAVVGRISANGVALAEGILQGMAATKLKIGAAFFLVAALIATGTGVLAHQALTIRPPAARHELVQKPSAKDGNQPAARERKTTHTDRYGDPLPPGAIARMGTVRFRHGGHVNAVVFSPDGRSVASAGCDNSVRIWELATGRELRRLLPAQGRGADTADVTAIAFSPDGRLLASGTTARNYTVRLWDASTGRELQRFKDLRFDIATLTFSPDGATLIAGGSDAKVCVWDVATGKLLRGFDGHVGPIYSLALSWDGKTLACCGDGLSVLEPATGKLLHQFEGHSRYVTSATFSPDGKTLISGRYDGVIRIWDAGTGRAVRTLGGAHGLLVTVALAPDGRMLASASVDSSIRLWDTASWKEVRKLTGHQGGVFTLAFSRDGKALARVWDVATGKEIGRTAGHQSSLWSVAFSADGKALATASHDSAFRLWEVATGKEIRKEESKDTRVIPGNHELARYAAFTPDGRFLIAAEGTIRRWDLQAGKELPRLGQKQEFLCPVVLAPDGGVLAAAGEGNRLHVWETATGKTIAQFPGSDRQAIGLAGRAGRWQLLGSGRPVMALALAAGGKFLAAAIGPDPHGDGAIIDLWETATAKRLWQFKAPAKQFFGVNALAFSPDQKILVAAVPGVHHTQQTRVWDVATGKDLAPFDGPTSSVWSLAFSPDGRTLATGAGEADGTVRLWEVATRQVRGLFEGRQGTIRSIAFSRDGRKVASAGGDTTALVWDVTAALQSGVSQRARLSAKDLDKLWSDLAAGDASGAYRATWTLAAVPEQSVPFLKQRLRPVTPVDSAQMARLLADLDSGRFAAREKAAQELEEMGESAEPGLRKALAAKPSLEVRRRIEQLLERLEKATKLRAVRAAEALEVMATPEARQVLEGLAKGGPDARLTQEAKASLDRLFKRPAARP